MDDIMMMEYLRQRGMDRPMNRHNSMEGYKEWLQNRGSYDNYDSRKFYERCNDPYMDEMYRRENQSNNHFNESYARYVVSNMTHNENGRRYNGEKFDMMKAREIQDKYRGIIPQDTTVADIYVALNCQYHSYCDLFKSWFGNNAEAKIIESAIVFWFKNSNGESKIWKHFKD